MQILTDKPQIVDNIFSTNLSFLQIFLATKHVCLSYIQLKREILRFLILDVKTKPSQNE